MVDCKYCLRPIRFWQKSIMYRGSPIHEKCWGSNFDRSEIKEIKKEQTGSKCEFCKGSIHSWQKSILFYNKPLHLSCLDKYKEQLYSESTPEPKETQNLCHVSTLIGCGTKGFFFRLKEDPKVGVKILRYGTDEEQKHRLILELQVAKALIKLGAPVPKYSEVIRVKIPKTIGKTLERYVGRGGTFKDDSSKPDIEGFTEKIKWGLVISYIEEDLTMVTRERIEYFYNKEAQKLREIGVYPTDSIPAHNVLWSKKEGKLYFMDFESWDIPSK